MSATALVFAVVKAVPAAAQILEQVAELWAAHKRNFNQADENAKKDRIAEAIAAARAAAPDYGRMSVCAACPFASGSGEQRGPAAGSPAIPGGGTGGS